MKKVKRAYAINLNLMLEHADQVFKAPVSAWFRYFVTHNLKVTGEERKTTLSGDCTVPVTIKPHSAVMWRFRSNRTSKSRIFHFTS